MKIIALFNLKKETDINIFYDWVINRQVKVFQVEIPKMKKFKVYKLLDKDNYQDSKQIVQIFDWEGTADEWRKTLESFRVPENIKVYEIAREWLNLCDDKSTKIIYAEDIK